MAPRHLVKPVAAPTTLALAVEGLLADRANDRRAIVPQRRSVRASEDRGRPRGDAGRKGSTNWAGRTARIAAMALGTLSRQARFEGPAELLGERLQGIYRFLAEHGEVLFPDEYFADLYTNSRLGQPTVPARVVATVMLLQSHEGLSDREATDRLGCDLRWQAAAGVHTGYEAFHPTLLVGMRNRLRASARPRRLFEDTRAVAKEAGVMKDRARALDSTAPLYMTPSPPRTPSPNCARLSASCSAS